MFQNICIEEYNNIQQLNAMNDSAYFKRTY